MMFVFLTDVACDPPCETPYHMCRQCAEVHAAWLRRCSPGPACRVRAVKPSERLLQAGVGGSAAAGGRVARRLQGSAGAAGAAVQAVTQAQAAGTATPGTGSSVRGTGTPLAGRAAHSSNSRDGVCSSRRRGGSLHSPTGPGSGWAWSGHCPLQRPVCGVLPLLPFLHTSFLWHCPLPLSPCRSS